MTDKELRKLRREDLLQILINQQRQIDELSQALEESENTLKDRRIAIEESGSIAEAALKLNDVFDRAQKAADHYLEETRSRADALKAEAETAAAQARREAERIIADARREAGRIQADAQRQVDEAVKAAVKAAVPEEEKAAPEEKRRGGFLRRNRA